MYIKDESDYDYAKKSRNCFAYGWLSSDHEFNKGWASQEQKEDFLNKIESIKVVDLYRGWHCDEGLKLKGQSNGSIKFISNGKMYVAPVAVIYYIRELDYLPPKEVVLAVKDDAYETDLKDWISLLTKETRIDKNRLLNHAKGKKQYYEQFNKCVSEVALSLSNKMDLKILRRMKTNFKG